MVNWGRCSWSRNSSNTDWAMRYLALLLNSTIPSGFHTCYRRVVVEHFVDNCPCYDQTLYLAGTQSWWRMSLGKLGGGFKSGRGQHTEAVTSLGTKETCVVSEFLLDSDFSASLVSRNFCLLLAFRLTDEGDNFFLAWLGGSFFVVSLVSKVKEKLVPILRENDKAWPWLASLWQKSRHWDVREESLSFTTIFRWYSENQLSLVSSWAQEHMLKQPKLSTSSQMHTFVSIRKSWFYMYFFYFNGYKVIIMFFFMSVFLKI